MNPVLRILRDQIWTFVGVVVAVSAIVVSLVATRQGPNTEKATNGNQTTSGNNNQKESPPLDNGNHIALGNGNQKKFPPPDNGNYSALGNNHERQLAPTDNANRTIGGAGVEAPRVRAISNDIGKSKRNELFEITIENAWNSTSAACIGNCSLDVPAEKKAVFVRFTMRRWASRQLSWDEQSNLLYIRLTDFLVVDDNNKRTDPTCTAEPFYAASESSHTLGYLVRKNSYRLIFRFQRAGLGDALTFDLSGLE